MNVEDPAQLTKLKSAVEASRRALEPFRANRTSFLRQYVGKHYSTAGSSQKVVVNFVELLVGTYSRLLAAQAPQANVVTDHGELRSSALLLKLALNHLIDEINLKETLEDAVLDAMFGVGIVKVGISSRTEEVDGVYHDVGQPFADVVSLDDWVHDTTSRTLEQCLFMGNRYRLPLEYVKTSGEFDNVDSLVSMKSVGTDEHGQYRASSLSMGNQPGNDGAQEMIELQDLYLPFENQIITLPVDQVGSDAPGDQKPLSVKDWNGPEGGPYRMLRLEKVPDNIMPLSPVSTLIDLHELNNIIFRKLGRQATRQKTVGVAEHGNEEDARRMTDASDGDVVASTVGAVKEVNLGGINQENFAFFLQSKDLFSWMGGNLDSLAGLSPMAETLGQEELIGRSASLRLATMRDSTVAFAAQIMRDLAWYLWTDPLIELPLVKQIPNTDIKIPATFSAETREGDFLDYNISIEPFSMQSQTPDEKLRAVMQYLQFLAPFVPMMQEQGATINFQALTQLVKQYRRIPELGEIIMFTEEPGNGIGPIGPAPGKIKALMGEAQPPSGVRRTVPGASRQGKDAVLSQVLLGGRPQPAEMATMNRNVG